MIAAPPPSDGPWLVAMNVVGVIVGLFLLFEAVRWLS